MLRVAGVFLRRPISIYSTGKGSVSFLYKIIGKGTEALSAMKPGEKIEVLGPLGKGYPVEEVRKEDTPILIAGGTGIASLHFLIQNLKKPGILIYGAKKKAELISVTDFRKKGWKIYFATDDGSCGKCGQTTNLFSEVIEGSEIEKPVVFVCGPTPMMRSIIKISAQNGIHGYMSLEEMMACGVGNCQGCAVKYRDTHKMVCKDGPVFAMQDVSL